MPITIDNIIQSNLELLNEQEQQVLELLTKIRKAKSFFSGNSRPGRPAKRGRPGRPGRPRRRGRPAKAKSRGSSKRSGGKRTTYMDDIIPLLQKNGKMKSGDLIKAIAGKRGKDYKKIQFSIYPVLSQATKSKKLGKSKGFYTLK